LLNSYDFSIIKSLLNGGFKIIQSPKKNSDDAYFTIYGGNNHIVIMVCYINTNSTAFLNGFIYSEGMLSLCQFIAKSQNLNFIENLINLSKI
jgi:hypothetical protein